MSILEHKRRDSDRAPAAWLPNSRNAKIRTYRGKSLQALLPKIRAELGDNAVILREREGLMGGVGGFFATRFIEVQARAGGPAIDTYDEDGSGRPQLPAAPVLPTPPLNAVPAPPAVPVAPSFGEEFSAKLAEAVEAWTSEPAASAEEAPVASAGPADVSEPDSPAAAPAPIDLLLAAEDRCGDAPAGLSTQPISAGDDDGDRTVAEIVGDAATEPVDAGIDAPDSERADDMVTESINGSSSEPIDDALLPAAPVAAPTKPRAARSRTKLPRKPATPRPIDGDAAARAFGDLVALGTSAEFARELIGAAAAHGAATSGGLRAAVRQELVRRLTPTASLPAAGGVVAFVGTGGSGKSLASAALAATYRYASTLAVSVYSLCDTHGRRGLAELLAADEVPVTLAPAGGARTAVSARRQIAAAREQGLVILDTPAVSPGDAAAVAELSERLEQVAPDAVYLVLSAALGATAARRALAGLAGLAPSGLVISHADETDQIGVLVELATSQRLPIAYVTAGADHRRSLIGSDPAALAQLLLP